jgi:hypothetical protein
VILILSHRKAGIVCLDALKLVLKDVSAIVASNDATCLPESNLIQEFVSQDADLANEQLVDVVGG